ncbi:MAG: acyl carrier protein [Motiliproteus sp.]
MNTQEEIYLKVVSILEELFEVDRKDVTPEAHLYQDLDIDSIDAVDLVVELKKLTGKKIRPDDFKAVRTVQDVVLEVQKLLENG